MTPSPEHDPFSNEKFGVGNDAAEIAELSFRLAYARVLD
jgi:hypothetical protein